VKIRRRRAERLRREWLLLRFGIVSAILAGLLGVVLTGWLTNFIRTTNIGHAQDIAEYSMSLSLKALDIPPTQTTMITPAQLAETTRLMRASVATGKFVGATAWIPPGIVVYGSEPGRIGAREKVRPQVTAAFKGVTSAAIIRQPLAGIPDPTERTALRKSGPVLEIFAVARIRNNVVAAVVLYQPWVPIQRLIDHETHQMLLLVLAGLLVLWLGLMRLMLTASRRLRTQSRENRMLASHDPLTGLANRSLLAHKVGQALRISERSGDHVGLLLFDLDHFKEVNDTFGHHTGDLLLRQIGPRLTGVLREGDFVARLGGDEFVVVLPTLKTPDEAAATAGRLLEAMSEPFHLDAVSLDVDASIGIAISPGHGTDGDALLDHADTGMYLAKKSGSGFATYSVEAESGRPKERPLLESLRAAAATDPSQFRLLYQPKADVQSEVVHGVEALLRWQHPTLGVLLAGDFLPVAERTGLILPLTDRLIGAVLDQIRTWSAQGLQLGVSLNISSRCLLDASFPARVGALLREHGVEAGMLEFEITEKLILADIDRAVTVLGKLDDLGVRLALDGFGSGFSAMGFLKRLPLHQIKIDSSLVTGMAEGSTDAAIVRCCIELARNLGLGVVAEGVETAEVWHLLADYGCQLAQGRYLANPMSGEQLPAWLQERARAARLAKRARRTLRLTDSALTAI
jgi:diguanylate cyclase (GGDEF)-like protein